MWDLCSGSHGRDDGDDTGWLALMLRICCKLSESTDGKAAHADFCCTVCTLAGRDGGCDLCVGEAQCRFIETHIVMVADMQSFEHQTASY